MPKENTNKNMKSELNDEKKFKKLNSILKAMRAHKTAKQIKKHKQELKLKNKVKIDKTYEEVENEVLVKIAKTITSCFRIYREKNSRKKIVSNEELIKLSGLMDTVFLIEQCFLFIFFNLFFLYKMFVVDEFMDECICN